MPAALETWGWIYTIVGAALIVFGALVFSRNQIARWVGVGAASASMVINMMWCSCTRSRRSST